MGQTSPARVVNRHHGPSCRCGPTRAHAGRARRATRRACAAPPPTCHRDQARTHAAPPAWPSPASRARPSPRGPRRRGRPRRGARGAEPRASSRDCNRSDCDRTADTPRTAPCNARRSRPEGPVLDRSHLHLLRIEPRGSHTGWTIERRRAGVTGGGPRERRTGAAGCVVTGPLRRGERTARAQESDDLIMPSLRFPRDVKRRMLVGSTWRGRTVRCRDSDRSWRALYLGGRHPRAISFGHERDRTKPYDDPTSSAGVRLAELPVASTSVGRTPAGGAVGQATPSYRQVHSIPNHFAWRCGAPGGGGIRSPWPATPPT